MPVPNYMLLRRTQIILLVFACALMMCCKEKNTVKARPEIYNIKCLDSLGYESVGIEIIPIDSLLPGEHGPVVPYYWNNPLHDAIIEFNKHFKHDIQDVIEEERHIHRTQDEIDEINGDPYGIRVRGAERDLDTIINHVRYVFISELG